MNFDIIDVPGARVFSDQLQLFANILSEFAGYPVKSLSEPTSAIAVSNQLMEVANKFAVPFSNSYDMGDVAENLRKLIIDLEKKGIISKHYIKNRAEQIYLTVDPEEQRLLDLRIP